MTAATTTSEVPTTLNAVTINKNEAAVTNEQTTGIVDTGGTNATGQANLTIPTNNATQGAGGTGTGGDGKGSGTDDDAKGSAESSDDTKKRGEVDKKEDGKDAADTQGTHSIYAVNEHQAATMLM